MVQRIIVGSIRFSPAVVCEVDRAVVLQEYPAPPFPVERPALDNRWQTRVSSSMKPHYTEALRHL
jgi:hypothetical protein